MRIDRRLLQGIVVLLAVCMSWTAFAAEAIRAPEVTFEPASPGPGDIMVVTVKNVSGQVEGTFKGKKVYFIQSKDSVKAVLGVDLFTEPGQYPLDIQAAAKQKILVLDIATSHTVGAALERGELAAFFEYHTRDITLKRLEQLLPELAEGKLEHSQILAEGGHGAYTRKALGFQACEIIVATGPKRKLLQNSQLPIHFGAPFGDNMMTGTVGLLEAIGRRRGLKPKRYV